MMMKKCITLLVSVFLTLAIYSTIVQSEHTKSNLVKVNIYRFDVSSVKRETKEIDLEEANKLKAALMNLAEGKRDADYEILEKLGISDLPSASIYSNLTGDNNISNLLCYFTAAGKGDVILPIIFYIMEKINESLQNVSSLTGAIALIIAMFAIYVPFILIAYLIPIKILAPVIQVNLDSGRMWTMGVEGFKKLDVEDNRTSVKLRVFTGLSILLPSDGEDGENFVFVSGFAGSVKMVKSE